jgi:hypothetical protein
MSLHDHRRRINPCAEIDDLLDPWGDGPSPEPDLAALSAPEQEAHLRTIAQPWRDLERRRLGLAEPLTDEERARILRDIEVYPEQWRDALLGVLGDAIVEIAAAAAAEVRR